MSNKIVLDPVTGKVSLFSPCLLPKASSFLWNPKMLLQMNCRGYATAQFMDPEPCQYSFAPNIKAETFMMPEQDYYAHHPGRFFYLKDEESQQLCSLPYEPVRYAHDSFEFIADTESVEWRITSLGLDINLRLTLAEKDIVESWHLKLTNQSDNIRSLSIYPAYTIGYMSWMNQSAEYDASLNSIVAKRVQPYQKLRDFEKINSSRSMTFLTSDKDPVSYCANQAVFEGEGGISRPDGVMAERLGSQQANYEVPIAAMQFSVKLKPAEAWDNRLLFGAAYNAFDIARIKRTQNIVRVTGKQKKQSPGIKDKTNSIAVFDSIETPDPDFNNFVNCWLLRQMRYHGETNRLTTDPQTRNYLQDAMGTAYVDRLTARKAFLTVLVQQKTNGALPDGILLDPEATLKYINQVPHVDHCVWLPICLGGYLDEHNDFDLLEMQLAFSDDLRIASVFEHVERAMEWLLDNRDERGLCYINQGDWCDPLNMVGPMGIGVSSWLSLATAYACKVWAQVSGVMGKAERRDEYLSAAESLNQAVNRYCWDGDWYARGITDAGELFGISSESEGRIYLNPQSWAILSGAAQGERASKIIMRVEQHLSTPDGTMMLSPSYTRMHEHIGRISQKSPGVAENGSVYNHAASFFAYSLFTLDEADRGYQVLRDMIPDADSAVRRGQLPVFIPNYYRGAYHQFPNCAGRSSHLINTGTVAWYIRTIVEGLFGLKGRNGELHIRPRLPTLWQRMCIIRNFAGATFAVTISRNPHLENQRIYLDGNIIAGMSLSEIVRERHYQLRVEVP